MKSYVFKENVFWRMTADTSGIERNVYWWQMMVKEGLQKLISIIWKSFDHIQGLMVSKQLFVLPITYYEAPLLPEKTVLTFHPTQEAQERKWDQVVIKHRKR